MDLTRGTETINYPCSEWVDEDGVTWSNPTLAFFLKRGFMEAVALPPTPEEVAAQKQVELDQNIRAVQQARTAYLNGELDVDGFALALELNRLGNAKGQAIVSWSTALGLESSLRQNKLKGGIEEPSPAMLDFSMFPKPVTADELIVEGVAAGLIVIPMP